MTTRPNILYIFTDQQYANAMSNVGNFNLKTPGIDSIAENGVRFDRAYCTWPLCTPSRASMFTGKMPSELGFSSNAHGIPEEFRSQEMGWIFNNAGYKTAYAGKWHLPGQHMEEGHGFEILSGMDDELATQKTVEFLKQDHDKPFLMVTSLWQPHGCCPYHRMPDPRTCKNLGLDRYGLSSKGPEDDTFDWPEDAYEPWFVDKCPRLPDNFEPTENEISLVYEKRNKTKQMDKKPEFWAEDEEWNAARNWTELEHRLYHWAYYRLVERLDGQVVRILDALKESGEYENTLIVFSSDHGDMMSAHRLTAKNVFYEEASRIPLLMSYTGNIPAGSTVKDELVSNGLDLMPTFCDYAGIEVPEGLKGRSLRTLAEGNTPEEWREDLVIEVSPGFGNGRLLHTGRYKYAKYDEAEELYNLETDPGEMKNLADCPEHQELKQELKGRLEDRLKEIIQYETQKIESRSSEDQHC